MNRLFKFLFAIAVILVIAAPVLVSAKGGGIKVDDDAICGDTNREDNALAPNCGNIIWINSQASSPGYYTCQICNNGQCGSCNGFNAGNWYSCGSDYYYTPFSTPGSEGSYTIVLTNSSDKNVSRDSFRVVSGEPCD
jgi:hypothetical protein